MTNRIAMSALMAVSAPALLLAATPAGAVDAAPLAARSVATAQQANIGEPSWEHSRRGRGHGHGHGHGRGNDQGYGYNSYNDGGRYGEPVYANTPVWRGDDGRYYCRRGNGTTGLIIGAAGGALLGREVARNGDRTLGAVLGAAGGALLGRSIDRNNSRCR